jgi:hypothetical protein
MIPPFMHTIAFVDSAGMDPFSPPTEALLYVPMIAGLFIEGSSGMPARGVDPFSPHEESPGGPGLDLERSALSGTARWSRG